MDKSTTIVLPMFGSAAYSSNKLNLLHRFLVSLLPQVGDKAQLELWSTADRSQLLRDAINSAGGTLYAARAGADGIPLWHKESLLNAALRDCNTEYFAWIDPDILFLNSQWLLHAIQQLSDDRDIRVVQLFSDAVDLDALGRPIRIELGIGYANAEEMDIVGKPFPDGAHSGYAWMARTDCLRLMGGFPDYLILGGADFKIAMGMLRRMGDLLSPVPDLLDLALRDWGYRAGVVFGPTRMGCIPGTIAHLYHGEKVNRKYAWRDGILHELGFSPFEDLEVVRCEDRIDLYQLSPTSDRFDALKATAENYFAHRSDNAT